MSNNALRVDYDEIEFDDDLALLSDVPYSGIIDGHYPDGQLEVEYTYVEGLPSGIQRIWYPNGQLMKEWDAVRGNGSRWSRQWHPNGTVREKSAFENSTEVILREWSEALHTISEMASKK